MLKFLLVASVTAYLAVLVALYLAQTRLLFPGGAAGGERRLPPSSVRLALETRDGTHLHGVHLRPGGDASSQRPLLLGFAGNAWNAEEAALYLRELFPSEDVIVFHYRGYAPSSGTPSAARLIDDAAAVHDQLVGKFGRRPVIAVGFSIGSGIAAHLAAERKIAGLILVTPFDSLARVARDHYPWVPVRLLFRHQMEPARVLARAQVPTAIIAAERDDIIPAARTDALRRAVPHLVLDRTIPGSGHNDIYGDPAFHDSMREAWTRLTG